VKPSAIILCLSAFFFLSAHAGPKVEHKTWTDPEAALHDDPDFTIQGEYRSVAGETAMGAQVIALGGGSFDAYLLDGGLPDAGWEPGKSRFLLKGERKGAQIMLVGDEGKTTATIENGILAVIQPNGTRHQLKRFERTSPTLGAKPPAGAVILFDGTSTELWENATLENGHLLAAATTSKQRFAGYTLHLEFRVPYKPTARGQQRGNSGVYHSGRWETQILDSFGLDSRDNDCGGIYSISKPRLNLCLPPLTWQTYDVEFTAAKFDSTGKRTDWPRITVRLNGGIVHENLELPKDFTTSAPLTKPLDGPEGPIFLQAHDNPVIFRNIWVLPGTSK
jgi:Domain of Unknown Function (DUF1080)